jgi:signal transduction histidine kinase
VARRLGTGHSISHGIKGLLTGLDGGIYLVNSGFKKEKPDRVKRGWNMVQRNVDQIRGMVLDILYYAKDRELTLSSIEVAKLMQGVKEALEKKAGDHDVVLDIRVAPDTGSFQGDSQAIRAMLLNILENSFDACRADRGKPVHHVKFEARRAAPWMIFEIADDGIGMDQETREKIFSLFFSSKGMKGTGLGLFISNKIVDKHGGAIDVESELGRGTRFLIRLPLEARPSTKPAEA